MKKIFFNNRPICFCALFLSLGLVVGAASLDSVLGRVIALSVAVVVVAALLILKKYKLSYIPIAFAVGIFFMSGAFDIYNSNKIEYGNTEIRATISSEIVPTDKGGYYFEVENITVEGQKHKGSATVFAYSLPSSRAGDEILITGDIRSRDYSNEHTFLSYYRKGNNYVIFADGITGLGEGKLSLASSIRVKLKRQLFSTVSDSTADITGALIFGDKYFIDDDLYSNVIASGLAHIFAVSGLHVGILAAAVYWLTSKLKIKGYVKLIAVDGVLLLYGLLCGFPSSVGRAIIMTTVFMLAGACGRQRDNLNALAFSAIVVLLINPTDILSVGFLMSYLSVLGIIMFEKPFERFLKFLPKGLRQLTATSLAVNLTLWPIMCVFFGSVQVLFLISNIIILPILPFIYIISLIICAFTLIMPFLSPVLVILNILDWPIKFVATAVGSLVISQVSAGGLGLATFGYYVMLFFLSRYVFIKRKTRVIASSAIACISILLVGLGAIYNLDFFTIFEISGKINV